MSDRPSSARCNVQTAGVDDGPQNKVHLTKPKSMHARWCLLGRTNATLPTAISRLSARTTLVSPLSRHPSSRQEADQALCGCPWKVLDFQALGVRKKTKDAYAPLWMLQPHLEANLRSHDSLTLGQFNRCKSASTDGFTTATLRG